MFLFEPFQWCVFFLFGLVVGSFLNVVIARLRTLESIMGRSFCRHCRKKIRWYDNIPLLSYVILKGKCRDCKETISWQYPLVEAGTALLFAFAGGRFFLVGNFSSWIETVFVLGVVAFSVIIAVYDARHKEIPMGVLWVAIIWTVGFLVTLDATSVYGEVSSVFDFRVHSGIVAAIIGSLFFFLLSALSRERWMGLGDAYVVFWMGLVLGWPILLFALLFAFTAGAVWGGWMIALKKSSLKSQIPFAPFLLGGMIVAIFFRGISFFLFLW